MSATAELLEAASDPACATESPEIARLQRRLARERRARAEAETITEKVTRELYDRQQELVLLQGVAVAANEATSIEDVMHTALKSLCAHTGWPVGHVYLPSDQNPAELVPTTLWHLEDPQRFETFRSVTEATPLVSGVGLPGRVLASGKPVWVTDVTADSNFPRAQLAKDIGVRGAFAFPVLAGKEVVAVIEFFSDKIGQPNERWLDIVAYIGTQLGRVLERKRAEEQQRALARKLESNNRELTDFAYVASHDLQEPLRKIQAFGERLKIKCAAALSEEGKDYLGRMQNAAGRMQILISDLLTISRITTKAQPFVPVDLRKIAQEVLSDLEIRIEQTKGHVELGELPRIDADPLQMRQLIQNLVGNALKFHRKDQSPRVKVYRQDDPSAPRSAGLCRILVEDNGIGFDEKYLDRIFGVFQRLHGRDAYEGTGVGLAICKKICERHNGSLTARSAPGQGATFIATLPLKQSKGHQTP